MELSPDASRRTTQLLQGFWQLQDWPLHKFMEAAGLPESYKHSLWRRLHGLGANPIWDAAVAEKTVAAAAAAPAVSVPFVDVWAFLHGKVTAFDFKLSEIALSTAWHPRPSTAKKLPGILRAYEQDAVELLSLMQVPPISVLSKEVVLGVHKNKTHRWGDLGKRWCAVLNGFYDERKRLFQLNGAHGSGRTTVLMFVSSLLLLRDRLGPYAGLSLDAADECFTDFMHEGIEHAGLIVGLIDDRDGAVPQRLIKHFAPYDGVLAIDRRFVMKMHRDTLVRTWCCAVENESVNYVNAEVGMLQELKKRVYHGWTIPQMLNAIAEFRPQA